VAASYDLMNDVMSLGAHRLWKAALVDALNPQPGQRFLDVAGGTGDIAFRIHDRLRRKWPGQTPGITVCDINPAMLAVGRDRAVDRNILAGIEWVAGDAETLPLPDQCMDAYTIAFGIRNVTHVRRALAEAHRVLRPGGRFLCLEFSHVALPGLDRLYDAYSFHVIPRLGGWIAKDAPSYQYLVESIRRFPSQDAFAAMIREAGFARVGYRNMTGGVVALHGAWRL
jgi:demethylmenaquinone methyltransferase/2-methoxy-6-polyprenyl-1,4-benzoquinol methylase